MCNCCDYDPPEFSQEQNVKAKKRQRCDECLRSIEPGESYRKICGKWDGEFLTFKTCHGCIDLAKRSGVTCWALGDLVDCLIETDEHPEISEWLEARESRRRAIESGRVTVKEDGNG